MMGDSYLSRKDVTIMQHLRNWVELLRQCVVISAALTNGLIRTRFRVSVFFGTMADVQSLRAVP
jgi:hypothetical protein